jgi:hypothetical protein
MAWLEHHVRSDGGTSYVVRWRLGGGRTGARQTETFGAGSDAQNRARAEGFATMVIAAGEDWPDGWVKGEGFVRARAVNDPMVPPPMVIELGAAYVRQIVDCSPASASATSTSCASSRRSPCRASPAPTDRSIAA